MKSIIAIDPGAGGAIAWRDCDGMVGFENMPATYTDLADRMRSLQLELLGGRDGPVAVIEKVGTYMPGNSGPAAAKFARHCGHVEMACYCLGIPTTQISPQAWMKRLGALPKDKKARKNKIKEMMAAMYPHLRVTLKNADALGILTVTEASG